MAMVSVCMITYNHQDYIVEALEGVFKQQSDFVIELILSNDCSTDQTHQKITNFLENNKSSNIQIKYFNHTENLGMMPNFKFALEQCKGKYIALCEGDDYWTDQYKLQKQVDFLEINKNYSICIHPCQVLNQNNRVKFKQNFQLIDYDYSVKNLLTYWKIPTASLVIKRDKGIIFPEWFTDVASGDIALLMLYYESGKIKLLHDYMSVYRITDTGASVSHKNYRMIHYRAKLYVLLNEFFNYKYEQDIYDALNNIYLDFSKQKSLDNVDVNKVDINKKDSIKIKRILKKIINKLKLLV